MSKTVARLYRDPAEAKQAVKHLLSSGFKAHDIGVLSRQGETVESVLGEKVAKVTFSAVGDLVAGGCLVAGLAKAGGAESKLSSVLSEAIGATAEAADYYEFALGIDGVLVVVLADESKATEARAILGAALGTAAKAGVASPGFIKASRMAGSNPVDAAMTGDFRRY